MILASVMKDLIRTLNSPKNFLSTPVVKNITFSGNFFYVLNEWFMKTFNNQTEFIFCNGKNVAALVYFFRAKNKIHDFKFKSIKSSPQRHRHSEAYLTMCNHFYLREKTRLLGIRFLYVFYMKKLSKASAWILRGSW